MIGREYGADPYVTKDGVTVAKEVILSDPEENMAAQFLRQAASKTAQAAGDGTTTATVYAESIYNNGLKTIANGANSNEVRRGLEAGLLEVVDQYKKWSRPVIDSATLISVAVCSANQDQLVGELVAKAINEVGKDGVVTIEEGRTLETFVDVVTGFQFSKGYISGNFVTSKETMRAEYESPKILVTDQRIKTVKQIISLLEQHNKSGKDSVLVIIAPEIEDEALHLLTLNYLRGAIKVLPIKAPSFGDRQAEVLEDIAVMTGAKVISQVNGISLETAKVDLVCGTCKKITADQDSTTIVAGNGDLELVGARIEHIKTRLSVVAHDFDREFLQERLAKMTGGVARIVVGGATSRRKSSRRKPSPWRNRPEPKSCSRPTRWPPCSIQT
jgi:chaperonin GroEL